MNRRTLAWVGVVIAMFAVLLFMVILVTSQPAATQTADRQNAPGSADRPTATYYGTPVSLDPMWSQPRFWIREGAVQPRMVVGTESDAERAWRDHLVRLAIRSDIDRIDAMVEARNTDAAWIETACQRMMTRLAPDFSHIEGLPDGPVKRTRDQLLSVCRNPELFKITRFLAYCVEPRYVGDDQVMLVVYYDQDQVGDEQLEARGISGRLPDGRGAVVRVAIRLHRYNPVEQRMEIVWHGAFGTSREAVENACHS